jgi:hypothetical protein
MPTPNNIFSALQGVKLLGALVMWECHGVLRAKRSDFNSAAKAAGLDKMVVQTPSVMGALAKALSQTATSSPGGRRLILRELRNDNAVRLWAVVDVTSVPEGSPIGSQVGTVINRVGFAKVTEELKFDLNDDFAKAVEMQYQRIQEYVTGEDLRGVVERQVKDWRGVRVFGRLQYVGADALDKVDSLQKLIKDSGAECGVIPVPDTTSSREAISMSAMRQTEQQIERLRKEMAAWKGDAKKAPRDSTLEKRIEEYVALRRETEDLADVLHLNAADLHTELEALEKEARTMMGVPTLPETAPQPSTSKVDIAKGPLHVEPGAVDYSKDEIEAAPVPEPMGFGDSITTDGKVTEGKNDFQFALDPEPTVTSAADRAGVTPEPAPEVQVPEFIDPEPPMGPPPSDAETSAESMPPDPEPVSTMPKPPAKPSTPNPNALTSDAMASMSTEGLKKLAKKLGIKGLGAMPRAAIMAAIESASTES